MKVGLITYHHTSNFGSLLQTYSLYKRVTELGFDCEIIDYRNTAVEKREKPLSIIDCTNIRNLIYYFVYEPKLRKKIANFEQFCEKKMKLSSETYNRENIFQCKDSYDIFLVGSDLVWDFDNNGSDTTYMLDFVDDKKKKIAYASSCGSVWNEKKIIVDCLSRFDYIGVREVEIQKTLASWLSRDIDFVCDPTMLIEPVSWKNLATSRVIKGKYILCYFEDPSKKIYKDAIRYGKRYGIKVYAISYKRLPLGIKAVRPTTIDEFLSLILYSEAVFSASYHGMLFSLYFGKELYFYKKGWNARQESLAKFCGIEDRAGYKHDDKINYKIVRERLAEFRECSNQCLKKYLGSN